MQAMASRGRPRLGAWPVMASETEFRVWAPKRRRVAVERIEETNTSCHPLLAELDLAGQPTGYFSGVIEGIGPGARYRYRLDDSRSRPDPATRFQPQGVHGPSQVIDQTAYSWRDNAWRGPRLEDLVIYELHVGTLTEAGTFTAAIEVLEELSALGITAVELMPIVPAPGRWNWGYDGVEIFAIRETYGTPDDFKALVDAAHALGLAVILDVVYNHLGPEGNYLADFGPYFSSKHHTPWGEGFDFDGPTSQPVRDYVIANALAWFEDYHVDGLRIDAIQFMFDDSPRHVTQALSLAVRELEQTLGRRLLLIGETNVYDETLLAPFEAGGSGFDAIWCDDFLHGLGVLLTGENRIPRILEGAGDVAAILEQGAVYGGPPGGRRRLPRGQRYDLSRLVWSLQNHDFVGNHPLGHRLTTLTSPATHRAAAALLLLYPAIPLLFMGEEFATAAPFHFFTDYGDEHLRQAVIQGRRAEYPLYLWELTVCPTSEDAFRLSRRGERVAGDAGMVLWYHDLLALRRLGRQEGWLSTDRLQVACDLERHLYLIQYAGPQEPLFVAVRLAPHQGEDGGSQRSPASSEKPGLSPSEPGRADGSITLALEGELLLSSEWADYGGTQHLTAGTEQSIALGLNEAIVGRGRLTLSAECGVRNAECGMKNEDAGD